MTGNIMKYVLFGLMVSVLFSCGSADEWGGGDWGNDSVTCPANSTITFLEGDQTVTIAPTGAPFANNFLYKIVVTDQNGLAIRDAKVEIKYPWASPALFDLTTWGGVNPDWVVQFYEGGVAVDSPYTALTDDFGIYELNIQYKGGGDDGTGVAINYFGDFTATCGANIGEAAFAVN